MMDWAHGPAGHFGGHPVPGLYHINLGGTIVVNGSVQNALGVDFRACDNYKNGFKAAKEIKIPTLSILANGDKMCPVKEGKKLADLIDGSKIEINKYLFKIRGACITANFRWLILLLIYSFWI